MAYITTLTSKGQVTIPIEIRQFLDLFPSERVAFIKRKKEVVLKPVVNFLSLKGSIKSEKKYSDQAADQAIAGYLAKEHAKESKAR